MTRLKEHLKKHLYLYILFGLTTILCILPLSIFNFPGGHDYTFHMDRISNISQNISNGHWFAPIYYGQLEGYGYASPLFYGDILLHIPGVLVTFGLTVEEAFRFFIILCFSSTVFVTYFCATSIFKNGLAAFVSTIIYAFSSYFCIDILTRVAIGEVQAFIFCPLVILGFFSIIYENGEKKLFLPLGLTGLIISHTLTAVAVVVILVLVSLFYIGVFIKSPKKLIWLGEMACLFFALSAFFVFPMIEQMMSGTFRATDGTTDVIWGTLADRALPLWALVNDFNYMVDTYYWIPNGIGISYFVALAFSIYMFIKERGHDERPYFYLIISTLVLLIMSDIFPWNLLQGICGSMQFPWRLMIFAILFLSISSGFIVCGIKNVSTKRLFAFLIVLFSLFSFGMTASPKIERMIQNKINHVVFTPNWHNALGAAEYLPSGSDWDEMLRRGDEVKSNVLEIADTASITRRFDELEISFENNTSGEAYLELPLVMYKGYTAVLEDGTQLELSCVKGYMRADISNIKSGTFVAKYTGTTVQLVSKIISITAIISILAWIAIKNGGKFIKSKRQKQNVQNA
ncbi:MAG: hypothetical protein RRY76_00645 [Clostridia bacterium]